MWDKAPRYIPLMDCSIGRCVGAAISLIYNLGKKGMFCCKKSSHFNF